MGNTVTRIPEEGKASNYNYRPAMLWEKKAYQTVMDYRNQKLEPRIQNPEPETETRSRGREEAGKVQGRGENI